MTVSMAVVPLLKDDAARSLMKMLETPTIKPYTEEERIATEKRVEKVLAERRKHK